MGRKRKFVSDAESKYLPPCRVCEGPAGGFHYGVNTCEACKGFFHRSSTTPQDFKCATSGKCPVLYTQHKICKKCRYAKCLAVGMAKNAIKTGRYSAHKRTQDTLEIKKRTDKSVNASASLEKSSSTQQPSDSALNETACKLSPPSASCDSSVSTPHVSSSTSSSPSSSSCSFSSPLSPTQDSNPSPDSTQNPKACQPRGVSPRPSLRRSADKPQPSYNSWQSVLARGETKSNPETVTALRDMYVDREEIAQSIFQAKEDFIKYLHPYMSEDELKVKALEHVETCRLKDEMFGSMQNLSDQEYDVIYARTGLDADGRQHRLDVTTTLMEIRIRALAKFAKRIPGFCYLDMTDQITHIKLSRFEVLFVTGYYKVDTEEGVVLSGDGNLGCILCIKNIHSSCNMKNNFSNYVAMSRQLKEIGLTEKEKSVLGAIVLMAPDRRTHLDGGYKASIIHEELVQCLIHLLGQRFKKPLHVFSQIVSMMVRFRTFADKLSSFFKCMRVEKYSNALQNPILREMLDFEEIKSESDESDTISSPTEHKFFPRFQSPKTSATGVTPQPRSPSPTPEAHSSRQSLPCHMEELHLSPSIEPGSSECQIVHPGHHNQHTRHVDFQHPAESTPFSYEPIACYSMHPLAQAMPHPSGHTVPLRSSTHVKPAHSHGVSSYARARPVLIPQAHPLSSSQSFDRSNIPRPCVASPSFTHPTRHLSSNPMDHTGQQHTRDSSPHSDKKTVYTRL